MGWVTAALLLVALTGAYALSKEELDPSKILLNSLSPEQLDSMVELRLQKLKEEIAETFESQLRRHHRDLALLEQRAVALQQGAGVQRRFRRDASSQQYWHSYNFDTHRDRELLKINDVAVDQTLGGIVIDKVIPLNLWDLAAIYRSEVHLGYVLTRGMLHPLLVKNSWTKSLHGCSCSHMAYQTSDVYRGCACCHPGNCPCPSQVDTCVPCGELSAASCEQHKPRPLLVDTAAGFQYYLNYFDPEQALQRVLVAYYGSKLSFYRIDDDGIQLVQSDKGLNAQLFDRNLTHLGYGEMYKNNDGTILKERFLFTFTAEQASHRYYTINTGKAGFIVGVQFWKAVGTEMRAWQVGGRVLVGVLNRDGLEIKELIKSPRLPKYELRNLQTIRLARRTPVMSWASFSMAFESYLVVVTERRAQLFNLGKNYTKIQDLVPRGELSSFSAVIPVEMRWLHGRTALLAGQGQHLVAYVWSSVTQSFNQAYSTRLGVHIRNWDTSFTIFDPSRRKSLVFVQGDAGPLTLRVEASLEEVEDPVASQVKALQGIVQPLKMVFGRQFRVLKEVRDALEHGSGGDVFDRNITVLGGIQVQGVLDTDNLKSEIILLETNTSGHVTKQIYDQNVDGMSQYHTLLDALNHTVINVNRRLSDAVPTRGIRKRIDGRKTILNGGISVTALTVDHLGVGRPLDAFEEPLPLDDMLTNIVRINDTRVVTGRKTLLQSLSVQDLNVVYLDDVPVKDLVTSGGDHVIGGTTVFSHLMARTVILSPGGTVGGIDLSEEVVTLNGDAALGACNFQGAVTVDSLTAMSKVVDGVDIQRLSSRTLTTLGGTVQGSLSFVSPPDIGILNTNKIMGVDISKFMETTLFKHKPAVASGRLVIPSVEVRGDVVVAGFINAKKFPDNYVINGEGTVNFGSQWFQQVRFGTLNMGPRGRVDGLLPSSMVTLHTPQTISGLKKFARGVYIKGDLNISSKIIDRVNLDELNSSLANIKSGSWKFDVVFEQFVTVPSVSCTGNLNGLDWAAFVNDIVYDDVPSVVINSDKVFRSGLTAEDVIFHNTFNGESFSNLVNISINSSGSAGLQVVTGDKTFLQNITFESLTTPLVAGVDVNEIAQTALYLNKVGQVVDGVKTFAQQIKVEELVVTGRISGLDVDQIVKKSTDQVFTAPQSLLYANFSDVSVISIHMAQDNTINGVDIPLLNRKRVSMTLPGYYSGVLTVEGPVMSHRTLTVGNINGFVADQLTSNLVMKDESSDISGYVKFTTLSVDGPLTTHNQIGANGLNISDINQKAIHLADDIMMTGSATWGDIVFKQDVAVKGLVSDVELQRLSNNVVYRDQVSSQIITGKKTFNLGLTVRKNLEALTINGIDLRTRLLTRHTEQIITAPYYFVSVDVRSALHILGLFNDQNLAGLASLGLSGTDAFKGKVTFHGDVSVGHLHLSGLYNGVDTAKRMADSISLYETNVTVKGTKTFMGNVTFQALDVSNINNVYLRDFLQHVVLRNTVIHLGREVKVEGSVWAPSVTVDSLEVEGEVDGVDYNKLMAEAIYLDRNQTIGSSLVFKKDVETQGPIKTTLLNNLNMATQYLTTNTEQTLPATLVLGEATTAQVDVDGRVNSWRLREEVAATMKPIGGQTVHGSLTLLGRVEVTTDLLVTGGVGRGMWLNLAQQAVNLHQNTKIEGPIRFMSPVVASTLTSPSSVVNGVDLGALLTSAWYVDQQITINVPIEFWGPVVFEGALLTNNTQDPDQLEHLQHQLVSAVTHHNDMAKNLTTLYKETCNQIEPLYKQLQDAIYEADHFEALYEDRLPHQRHSSEAFYAFNTTFLVVSWKGNCETAWYTFRSDMKQLQIKTLDNTFWAHQWLFLGGTADEVYVAAAASAVEGLCNITSTIWRVTNTTIAKYQSLKEGERISMLRTGYLVTLRVHSPDTTTTYILHLTTGELVQRQTILEAFDLYSSIVTRGGQIVTFRSNKGHGTLLVDNDKGEVVEADRSIDDSMLLEENGRVYLLLTVTREDMNRDEFLLELHSVDLVTRTLDWESVHKMAAKTLLTVFYAGSPTTGSYMVVALQEGHTPVIYSLVGATLREFASLSTQQVSWIEHVETPSQLSPYFPHHHLLLGQYNRSYVLTRLVMRGGTVPHRDHICD